MSEPDFEQIAKRINASCGIYDDIREKAIIEALRQVWNARGAADIAAIEADWKQQNEVYGDSTLLSVVKALDMTKERTIDDYHEQLRRHIAAIDGRRPQDGHSERGFSRCPHPDCAAFFTVPVRHSETGKR